MLIFFPVEIEYFVSERGCMIVMRAQKLIEAKCDQMGMRLIRKALCAIRSCTADHPLRQNVSVKQHLNLLEMYLSLLYKYKKLTELKNELDSMTYDSAKEFIYYSYSSIKLSTDKKSPTQVADPPTATETVTSQKKTKKANKKTAKKSQTQLQTQTVHPKGTNALPSKPTYADRLYKYHSLVHKYALQLFLIRLLSTENSAYDFDETLNNILYMWIIDHMNDPNFRESFRKLMQTSKDNSLIYFCCDRIHYWVIVAVFFSFLPNRNKHIFYLTFL